MMILDSGLLFWATLLALYMVAQKSEPLSRIIIKSH